VLSYVGEFLLAEGQNMTGSKLFKPLRLPNGTVIPNRIAKAAMEENLANEDHAPGEALVKLYRRWAEGGAGLIITGNVMVDRHALTGPAGVVLEDDRNLVNFRLWADACRSRGAQAWMQINHPGRQLLASMGQPAGGPSAVAVDIPGLSKAFVPPRALNEQEIEELIERYTQAAVLAERAGFTGVEIHAAHGYLFSQFLSPLTNQRNDRWGGSLENRAQILLQTIDAIRQRVAPIFCVAVKSIPRTFSEAVSMPRMRLEWWKCSTPRRSIWSSYRVVATKARRCRGRPAMAVAWLEKPTFSSSQRE
jgi:2,4-dienoyl-CoA reductase-like NADH-dependent reductase (Old Yellow Enzyme family)